MPQIPTKQAPICGVPQEILIKIFGFLDIEEIIHSIQHVCQRWKAITKDRDLWSTLVYSPDRNQGEHKIATILKQSPLLRNFLPHTELEPELIIRTLVQFCHGIRRLRCDNWPRISVPQMRMVLDHYPSLVYLHVKFLGKDARSMLQLLGNCQMLRTLSIEGESHTIPNALLPVAYGCPKLEHFYVQGSMVFSSNDFVQLLIEKKSRMLTAHFNYVSNLYPVIQALSNCDRLEDVSLVEDPQNPNVSLLPLKRVKTLKSLTFYFKNGNGQNLFDAAHNSYWPYLQKFILYFGSEPYDVLKLKKIVSQFPTMQKLVVTGQHPQVMDISDSFERIHMLEDLQYLDFSNCQTLSDDGIRYISQCSKLKYLNVSWCRCLTDMSVEFLSKCKWLESLIMNGCNITGSNFELFIVYFDSLRLLSLKSCKKLSHDAVRQLGERKPKLEVEMYF